LRKRLFGKDKVYPVYDISIVSTMPITIIMSYREFADVGDFLLKPQLVLVR